MTTKRCCFAGLTTLAPASGAKRRARSSRSPRAHLDSVCANVERHLFPAMAELQNSDLSKPVQELVSTKELVGALVSARTHGIARDRLTRGVYAVAGGAQVPASPDALARRVESERLLRRWTELVYFVMEEVSRVSAKLRPPLRGERERWLPQGCRDVATYVCREMNMRKPIERIRAELAVRSVVDGHECGHQEGVVVFLVLVYCALLEKEIQ